jgi:thymidylate synthase
MRVLGNTETEEMKDAGIALLAEQLWALPLFPGLLLLMTWGVIMREEQYLEQRFGEPHWQYNQSVRWWLWRRARGSMMMREAPCTVTAHSLGLAWVQVAERILARGVRASYDTLPIKELAYVTLVVRAPEPEDPLIAEYGDSERLAWMRANFTDFARVPALGNADSYATRLYDYARSGRDQIAWVVERLRTDPLSRSATITTFQPLTDTSYIPCVSMLDFWMPHGALELAVYAHSIDFGAKGYANLVELAALQQHVAIELAVPAGQLLLTIKSAHIYEAERAYMDAVLRKTLPQLPSSR